MTIAYLTGIYMKHLLLLFGLLLPFLAYAQQDDTCYGSFELFGAGGFGSDHGPGLSSRSHQPATNYRLGFGASFRLGKRTLLRTTAQFNTYGVADRDPALRYGTQHDGMGGIDPTLPAGEIRDGDDRLTSRHFFAELGVSVRYYPRMRSRVRLFGELGVLAAKYGTTQTKYSRDDNRNITQMEPGFRELSPVGRLGLGADLPISPQIALYSMVSTQHHLRSLQDLSVRRVQPWQLDLEFGVRVFVQARR